MEDFEQRIARYLAHRMPQARDVRVEGVQRFHGGASRETYRLTLRYRVDDRERERGLVVRRDPTSSLIETERQIEFGAYQAFHPTPVPVPEPLHLELDESWLDRPFFVMEEITGCEPGQPLTQDPYGEHRETVGEQFWRILGHIHAREPRDTPLSGMLDAPAPEECWRRELDYWVGVLDEDELEPQPIVRAAIRYLRSNPPPPAQKIAVVHGDYRNGNFLVDDSGEIRAVLDWEMAHLGDPLEDLGWALDPLWSAGDVEHPGGMIARERAIRLWEETSGLKADSAALEWWEVFAHVKGLAIWISSAREFQEGTNEDPVLAISALFCTQAHDLILAMRMAGLSPRRWT